MSVVKKLYGRTPAASFGPRALKAVRQHLIDQDQSRRYINDNVKRVVQIFRWAVSEELVPAAVHQALQTVRSLEKGPFGRQGDSSGHNC